MKRLYIIPLLLLALILVAGCSQQATPTTSTTKAYVGSMNSDKFHRPSCKWAQNIKDENAIWFSSKEEAVQKGYTACKTCKP